MASTQLTTTSDKLAPFRSALAKAQQGLAQALPATARKYLTPDRLAKITLSAISRSPQLLQCTPQSVLLSVMQAASLGLEPSGPLGHAYLVPFKNKNGTMECQLIIGYRGFIALARRSGEIQSVTAQVVYSKDTFDLNLAEGTISHKPHLAELPPQEEFYAMSAEQVEELTSRGRMLGVYCVATFVGGGRHVDFLTVGDVEAVRSRSRSRDSGPWMTDYEAMAKKTAVRRASHYWPLSTELANALDAEGKAEAGEPIISRAEAFQVFDGEAPAPAARSVTDKVLGKLQARVEPSKAEAELAELEPPTTREERERSFKAKHKRGE